MTDHPIAAEPITRGQVIDGLRQLADYLDAHPDVPVGQYACDASDRTTHGCQPITRDSHPARPGVSNRLAFDLLGPAYMTPRIA